MNKQVALIARWHRRVIDSGTKLLSISCFDNTKFIRGQNAIEDDLMSFQTWGLEFTTGVIDGLHDFCFFLRKMIERADLRSLAKMTYPHANLISATINQGSPYATKVVLCKENLWWILGRVIHSTSVVVLGGVRSDVLCYTDGKTREYQDSRIYVEVESDLDRKEGKNT
ncbi:hypothetical protein [Burkholderia ubonensis]|uniref:hypothetical protein n=1 Tax=Burkholderia ubonensis TaxID=101571 RepID=UPI0012F9B90F|nr:hypothetical protein [Burkholderia ubonensis]